MPKKIQSYQDLVAWQKAIDLVTKIFRFSQRFPKEESFGLTSQLRRAAVSIPSNIAEGHSKTSTKEYLLFLGHARGSLSELETQVLIARNLSYLKETEALSLLDQTRELGRILNGLLASLRRK